MYKRWYENDPTLSMGISLLQNAPPVHRDQVIAYIRKRIEEDYPEILQNAFEEKQGFWSFLQRRQTMDDYSWRMVEALRFVPEEMRRVMAAEMIVQVYCLETEDYAALDDAATPMKTAM